MANGARKTRACEQVGLSIRTYQRWLDSKTGQLNGDRRQSTQRPKPHNKLSEEEIARILDICNSEEFADLTPSCIVPSLADKGIYLASESTFYRVLKQHAQLKERSRAKPKVRYKKPEVQTARRANQVWSWDISYLPSTTKGKHYYLYMIEDIFSRKIVGADVYEQESGEDASELLQRTTWKEKCVSAGLTLHSDNGGPMRSYTMSAKMEALGVISSYSRPRVSNDNPYSEALFRTVKYHPSWTRNGFSSIEQAQAWTEAFVQWYNFEHKHSRIKYVTPQQRHSGEDIGILEKRKQVYLEAKRNNPRRWSTTIRNWEYIKEVYLNPEKEAA